MLNGDLRVSPHSVSAFIETGKTDRSAFSWFSPKHVCKDYLLKCITFPVCHWMILKALATIVDISHMGNPS